MTATICQVLRVIGVKHTVQNVPHNTRVLSVNVGDTGTNVRKHAQTNVLTAWTPTSVRIVSLGDTAPTVRIRAHWAVSIYTATKTPGGAHWAAGMGITKMACTVSSVPLAAKDARTAHTAAFAKLDIMELTVRTHVHRAVKTAFVIKTKGIA